MGMLGKRFPKAQFIITGVLGPQVRIHWSDQQLRSADVRLSQSNAHGPNEFLHIDFAKKITCCMAEVVAEHAKHSSV